MKLIIVETHPNGFEYTREHTVMASTPDVHLQQHTTLDKVGFRWAMAEQARRLRLKVEGMR